MINEKLHLQPEALDSVAHRRLKLKVPITDWSIGKRLNAIFVAAVEFGDVCRDFPIVFVKSGLDPEGKETIAPVAVFGLAQDDNLYVNADGRWRANYIPAMLRSYPFCIARINAERYAICVDKAFQGYDAPGGERLFDEAGAPTEMMKAMSTHLETLETEIQRTRYIGQRLLELDLLQDMRFDATLPDGRQHTVDGFLTVNEKKATELPDAVVMELHRNGLLGLLHLHWVSLGNMKRLADWHAERVGATAPAVLNA